MTPSTRSIFLLVFLLTPVATPVDSPVGLAQGKPFDSAQGQQKDPFNGTWKLDVARSKMQPATASKSEIIHYRVKGDEEEFVSEAVTAEGHAESITYTAREGKASPFTITVDGKVTNPGAMTTVKKIDARTRERYNVRDGKPVLASRRVVSPDGKTMTITIVRIDGGREIVNEVRVLDKQP